MLIQGEKNSNAKSMAKTSRLRLMVKCFAINDLYGILGVHRLSFAVDRYGLSGILFQDFRDLKFDSKTKEFREFQIRGLGNLRFREFQISTLF